MSLFNPTTRPAWAVRWNSREVSETEWISSRRAPRQRLRAHMYLMRVSQNWLSWGLRNSTQPRQW